MLRALFFIVATFLAIKASAASDGTFACFKAANQMNKSDALASGQQFGINYLTDFSFNILSDGKTGVCTIDHPSSEHHGGPPFRVQIKVAGKAHFFIYGRDEIKEVIVPPQELKLFPAASCYAANQTVQLGTWEKAIQLQLNKAQEQCDGDEGGQTAYRTCYNKFQGVLKTCANSKTAEIKRYAQERLRAIEAHINFKDSTLTEMPGDAGAGK